MSVCRLYIIVVVFITNNTNTTNNKVMIAYIYYIYKVYIHKSSKNIPSIINEYKIRCYSS